MTTTALLALVLAFQQGAGGGSTTPPGADTVGYWQQHVHYQIVATLDERAHVVHGTATLTYVNHSPDTLHEMYFQQYLNAFRPGSKWSAVDAREGRDRFQHLKDPDYGYDRFTSTPTFGGVPVTPEYPGAPDSTVARFTLPRPLPPGDSVVIRLGWDARVSTVLRRQGRKGRSYDFAQWFPKVAVYDRHGWEPNPLAPSGEMYGEFGTYDVTLVVPWDQVIAATGVPISGDPGWAAAKRWGILYIPRDAYDSVPPAPVVTVPPGDKAVRFFARNVHHFAWSVSPDYRYEGGIFVRRVPATHFKTWDTVAINVLYRPGDDSTWGGGIAVRRSIQALRWLEEIYGPYAWPTFTNVHRLEAGGTEFPMMIMDGSAGLPLILHETGHQFTYGILANNEWASGWMDEGLTSYQTAWALGQTPQQLAAQGPPPPPRLGEGYRAYATTMSPEQARGLGMVRLDLEGHTQPIGTPAYDFRDFGTYNAMVYTRAELMYSQLRDVLGDSLFRAFLHDYYDRWALKHVDAEAMEGSVERVAKRPMGWFFDEWLHRVGLTDYALTAATASQQPNGGWVTQATVVRRGAYRHPMPVGVRTDTGWSIARARYEPDAQIVTITTATRPLEVRLDPYHTTYDWDRRDDVAGADWFGLSGAEAVYDWPFLNQASRDHALVALSPLAWYSNGGALTLGMRARTSYLNLVDRYDFGLAVSSAERAAGPVPAPKGVSRLQGWWRFANPYWGDAPRMGLEGGAEALDGIWRVHVSQTKDLSALWTAPGPRLYATIGAEAAGIFDPAMLPHGWEQRDLVQAHAGLSGTFPAALPWGDRTTLSATLQGAAGYSPLHGSPTVADAVPQAPDASHVYGRVEAALGSVTLLEGGTDRVALRVYAGASNDPPAQAALHVSASDPLENFENNWYRPAGAILVRSGVNYLPIGGAGLRGYDAAVTADRIVAGNAELSRRVIPDVFSAVSLWVSAFGDVGAASSRTYALDGSLLLDVGAGLALRGRLYDRDVTLRLDAPILVHQTALAGGRGLGSNSAEFALRWTFSFGDLW